jgi:hypothetical protein
MLVVAEVAHTTVFPPQQLRVRVVLEAEVQGLLMAQFQPYPVLPIQVVVVVVLAEVVALASVEAAALA